MYDIAIGSGKGGTGKTFIATNLAVIFQEIIQEKIKYLDCDVEGANGHLFFDGNRKNEKIIIKSVRGIDYDKCILCGDCVKACQYNALAKVGGEILYFNELCHTCGACGLVCQQEAIIEGDREIGEIINQTGKIDLFYGNLKTGESGMSPRLINKVKEKAGQGINIYDAPPGTTCPVVETFKGSDLALLVTDPTPFGLNDLKLAVKMTRKLGLEPVVIVNRATYKDTKLKEYCQKEDLKIVGEIPDRRELAEIYSNGELAVEKSQEYKEIFKNIANNIINHLEPVETKELVVVSGKGGTGKTSVTASLAALAENIVVADCDVDAADLHLLLNPDIQSEGAFSGGNLAEIDQTKCTGCGLCYQACRFSAIIKDGEHYSVDPLSCEGCGVCDIVCQDGEVFLKEAVNGRWFTSKTRFGLMAHAELGIAEENSGKLVTLVKDKARELANKKNNQINIIDGSPGTGCPVTASLTGADYALIVTEPSVSGIHDLARVIDLIKFLEIPAGILVNKADINYIKSKEIEELAVKEGIDFFGELPYDEDVVVAQTEALTIIEYRPDSQVSKVLFEVWKKINNIIKSD
ncbi:4Fe-4S binding protein [Halanaerobiaceae bacterium Z-7014]|uniref:4Fe-4S binding protein n=1 Tax=Halonatronomonas betaini TaxID=2778430 RepID=A0A931F9Y4_9FIRM|nr:4Fe-4S binding protein [Halonatronomonas betaini]MBF8436377.1 4Fe-4S binding protein [Halonatronomonas betaini]